MPDATENQRYRLARTDPRKWVIYDGKDRMVADLRLTDDDDGGETILVKWLTRTPLPVRYATAEDVVADLVRWSTQQPSATKPVLIPHHAPTATRARP
jgi:hypothetical protein